MPVMSVWFSSNPPIGWPNVRVGVLTKRSVLPWVEDLSTVETDTTFDPGDSGGPILNLEARVLGIAQASWERTRSGE